MIKHSHTANGHAPWSHFDDYGVRTDAAAPMPAVEATLLATTLVVLCGNLPMVLMHTVLGLKSAPIWPLYFAMYGMIAVFIAARVAAALQFAFGAMTMTLLTALPLVSTLWSAAPGDTVVQAAALVGTALTGLCLAVAMPAAQALRTLAIVATASATLDLAAIVALPSVGIEQDGPWVGTWRGLHDQKNGLGAFSAMQLMLVVGYVRYARRLEPFVLFGLALNLFLLIAARSTTAWLTAALCLPMVMAPRVALQLIGRIWPMAIVTLAVWMIIDPDIARQTLEALPAMVGKDSTLSNRLPVWTVLGPYLDDAPWLGFGYGAFWSEAIMPGEVFMAKINFLPGSAHSSVFEIRLALGYLGLIVTALMLVAYTRDLWVCDRASPESDEFALATVGHAFLTFVVFQSLTESMLLNRNDLVWVLMVWLATFFAAGARRARGV